VASLAVRVRIALASARLRVAAGANAASGQLRKDRVRRDATRNPSSLTLHAEIADAPILVLCRELTTACTNRPTAARRA
jgi:hypothetical protein